MRGILSTGEPQDIITAERRLACSVIWSGILDMISNRPAKRKKETPHVHNNRCGRWEHRKEAAYEFLTGQTAIGRYWFELAGVEPMEGKPLEIREYLRENIARCGIKTIGEPV